MEIWTLTPEKCYQSRCKVNNDISASLVKTIWQVAKPGLQPKAMLGNQQEAIPASKAGCPLTERSTDDIWAEDGVEQLAGKTWDALEAERKAEDLKSMNLRVQAAAKGSSVSLVCAFGHDSSEITTSLAWILLQL